MSRRALRWAILDLLSRQQPGSGLSASEMAAHLGRPVEQIRSRCNELRYDRFVCELPTRVRSPAGRLNVVWAITPLGRRFARTESTTDGGGERRCSD